MGKCARSRLGLFCSSVIFLLLAVSPSVAGCTPEVVSIRGDFGQAQFRVEVADDAQERAKGLMHRTSMPMAAGMLFVYAKPQAVSFWMRNTLIPLDMLFVGETGEILRIHHKAIPLDETPINGGDNVFAVLEINGGLSDRLGLKKGDVLRHPAFSDAIAAWPCGAD